MEIYYKRQLEFNNEQIKIHLGYKKSLNKDGIFSQDKEINLKLFFLIKDNIEIYSKLKYFKKQKKRNILKTKKPKEEKYIWLNSKKPNCRFGLPLFKKSEITKKDLQKEEEFANLHYKATKESN